MTIQQLSIFLENKTGRMAEVTQIIGDAGIDIRALSLADTSDFGILRLIVDKPTQAVETLRAAGLSVSLTDVIAVGIPDVPGAFAGTIRVLGDAGMNVEYMYAFVSRQDDQAVVILRVEDAQKAAEVLQSSGITLLRAEAVYNL